MVELAYQQALDHFDNNDHSLAYNLLLTRSYLMITLREHDSYHHDRGIIGINSLGFLGTLAFKTQADIDFAIKIGPLELLKGVAFKKDELIGRL